MSIKTSGDIRSFQVDCLHKRAKEDFEIIKNQILEEAEKCKKYLDLNFDIYKELKNILQYEGYEVHKSRIYWHKEEVIRKGSHVNIAYNIYMDKLYEYDLERYEKIKNIVSFIESSIKEFPFIKSVKLKDLNEEQIEILEEHEFKVEKDQDDHEFNIMWN